MVKKIKKSNPWLFLIGLDMAGYATLAEAERARLASAARVFTSSRLKASLPRDLRGKTEVWKRPLEVSIKRIMAWAGTPVVVLATGDPMHFGIGATLARHVPAAAMHISPAVSAFSLAAARMAWPLAEVATISLHGPAPTTLARWLLPGRRILALTRDETTASHCARILHERGYGASKLTVWSDLGAPTERAYRGVARRWRGEGREIGRLNTIAIECERESHSKASYSKASRPKTSPPLITTAGLPDDAFVHDGVMTKQTVRAVTVARLAPGGRDQVLWDVGAGCGSVALEWARLTPGGRVFAIESRADRRTKIAQNSEFLGVSELTIIPTPAPSGFDSLPSPTALFIGGGLTTPGLVTAAAEALRPGGRLVSNAVTLAGQRTLIDLHALWGGELEQIAIAQARPVGAMTAGTMMVLAPSMTVWQWSWRKPTD